MTTLDILLPFYGDVSYLRLAVESIKTQSDPDWRLVVADDAYPDPAVAEWFAEMDDPRVVYHRFDENVGANANYRRALALAEASHVVVMGADDVMLPDYVRVVRRTLSDHPGAAVVQPGVTVVDADGRVVRPLVDRAKRWLAPRGHGDRVMSGEVLATSLLHANWTYFPSLCWDRRLVQQLGFRPGWDVVQDLALLLDVAFAGGSLVVVDDVVFHYRRHSQSDSSVRAVAGARFDEERRFFATLASECAARGWGRAARAARWHLMSRLHAAALTPRAVRAGQPEAVRTLARHVVGPLIG